MASISSSLFRSKMSDYINRAAYGRERVVIRKSGKELVALVSLDDLRLLQELEDKADIAAAQRARKGPFVSLDELEQTLDLG